MENIKTAGGPVGPEPELDSKESPEIERELQLWAELLLDIYLDKQRHNLGKPSDVEEF